MRTLYKRTARRGGVALAGSLLAGVVIACGSASAGARTATAANVTASQASKGPINVGGIFTDSPFPFGTDALNMTKAVFASVNADGGINGRKINFLPGNDSESTTTASQLVRKDAGSNVVAYVGSASFVDCSINGPYYEQHGIVSITAVGVPEQCYTNPNIASVEPSAYTQLTASLYYAYKYLHLRKQCLFQPLTPGAGPYVAAAVNAYEKETGNKLVIDDTSVPDTGTASSATLTPLLLQAKDAGCQSFFDGGINDTEASLLLSLAASQGMQKVTFLGVSISYDQSLAQTAAKYGVPFYAITSLYPFTSRSSKNAAFLAMAKKYKVNVTEFSADAYMSAEWLVSALEAIKGPITAKSVTAYFKAGHRWSNSMSPTPLVFGSGKVHQSEISKLTVVHLTKSGWKLSVFGMTD
jgi:branched-chain amino acid transport system substrate-binding protein